MKEQLSSLLGNIADPAVLAELQEQVARALKRLEPIDVLILYLANQGKTNKEIARKLKMSEEAVKKRRTRAVEQFRGYIFEAYQSRG